MSDIDDIIRNSSKAEMLEAFTRLLATADKVIVCIIQDRPNGSYTSQVMTLGMDSYYEAYGILEAAKNDLLADDKRGIRD